jgi:hypothetical protein
LLYFHRVPQEVGLPLTGTHKGVFSELGILYGNGCGCPQARISGDDSVTGTFLLRVVVEDDLPIFFEQQLDPDANLMAAFTAKDPTGKGF